MSADKLTLEPTAQADLLADKRPCPFCGGKELRIAWWSDDDGEFDAVECHHCKAAAPAAVWNRRSGAGAPLPDTIQQALNSGDGVYRP